MVKSRRRSSIAVDVGAETPNATANSTTATFRRRGGGRRANTRRQNLELLDSNNRGQPLGQNNNLSGDDNMSEDERIGSKRNTNRAATRPTSMNL